MDAEQRTITVSCHHTYNDNKLQLSLEAKLNTINILLTDVLFQCNLSVLVTIHLLHSLVNVNGDHVTCLS